jgi:hypothetical protein
VAIFSTLGLARTLTGILRERDLLDAAFVISLLLFGTAVLLEGLNARPKGAEIGVAIGVVGVYLLVFYRMAIPEERSHLMEYGIVALLIYEALVDRASQGRRVPLPALLALVVTVLLGWTDEITQANLPNRVYDIRDVGFNALAGLMAILASLALAWARRRWRD